MALAYASGSSASQATSTRRFLASSLCLLCGWLSNKTTQKKGSKKHKLPLVFSSLDFFCLLVGCCFFFSFFLSFFFWYCWLFPFWETQFGRWFSVSGFCCGLRCGQCLVAGNSNSTFTAAFLVLFALVFLGVFVLFSGQKLAFLSLNCCGALRCVGNEKGKKEAEEEKTKKKQKNKKKKKRVH